MSNSAVALPSLQRGLHGGDMSIENQDNQHTSSAYPGMLPTLGLTKYKNLDLQTNQNNPYRVQTETEKLLVVREREREFRDFNKLEKES